MIKKIVSILPLECQKIGGGMIADVRKNVKKLPGGRIVFSLSKQALETKNNLSKPKGIDRLLEPLKNLFYTTLLGTSAACDLAEERADTRLEIGLNAISLESRVERAKVSGLKLKVE